MKMNIEALESELRPHGDLWPVSLVAQVGGVSRQCVYGYGASRRSPIRFVRGYRFVSLTTLLDHR